MLLSIRYASLLCCTIHPFFRLLSRLELFTTLLPPMDPGDSLLLAYEIDSFFISKLCPPPFSRCIFRMSFFQIFARRSRAWLFFPLRFWHPPSPTSVEMSSPPLDSKIINDTIFLISWRTAEVSLCFLFHPSQLSFLLSGRYTGVSLNNTILQRHMPNGW